MSGDAGDIVSTIESFGAAWAAVSALALVLVYLFGYLSIRFHHTAIGLTVGLHLFDHRYLFAGGRFLIFLLVHLCRLALVFVLLAAMFDLTAEITPVAGWFERSTSWLMAIWPGSITVAAYIATIAALVFVFRYAAAPLRLSYLLVRSKSEVEQIVNLPGMSLAVRTLGNNTTAEACHFAILLVGTILSGLVASWLLGPGDLSNTHKLLGAALAVATTTQLVLLPANHGLLIADKTVTVLERGTSILGRLLACGECIEPNETECLLLYRDGSEAAILVLDDSGPNRIVQLPAESLNGHAEIGIMHLGELILERSSP